MKIIGIDLAGQTTNPSGLATLSGRTFRTRLIYSDAQIIDFCTREQPALVAIDAPLSFPTRGNLRDADASLIKRGLRVFPPTFTGMRSLTKRGILLAKKLGAIKIRAIEVHPRTSGLIMFKTPDRERWITELGRMGFRLEGGSSRHELDAVIAAVTGALHLRRKTEEVGKSAEGKIVIPLPQAP